MKKFLSLFLSVLLLFNAGIALADLQPADTHALPLTDTPTTYTWAMVSAVDDPAQQTVWKRLAEATNVDIDWIIVPSADVETRRNLMWANVEDMPDVVGNQMVSADDVSRYYQYGVLLPISDFLDYMPNLKAILEQDQFKGILDAFTMPDGKLYSLPNLEDDNHTQVTCSISISTKRLNELGLDMPTTTDELVEVLKAFKAADPDCIPFAYCYGQDWMNGQFNAWFGITQDWMIHEDGTVTYSPYEEGYREMAKFLRTLWSEGLMDPELFTQDLSTFNAKGFEGRYGVFQSYGRYVTVTEDQLDDYAYLQMQKSTTDVCGSWRSRPDGGIAEACRGVVSANVKNPELLLSYLDMLYDPYWGLQISRGAIGEHLLYNDNGYLVINPEIPSQYATYEEWRKATCNHQVPAYKNSEDARELDQNNAEQICYNEHTAFYRPYFINRVLPYNIMYPEENEAISYYATDITKYAKETLARWISGEGDPDAEWDSYRAQMERLGVKEYVAAYQAYVDRVLAE